MFLARARWAVSEHTTRIVPRLHNCGAPSGSCVVYNLVAFLPFYSFAVDTFPFIWCDPNVLRIIAEYCRPILENLQKTQMQVCVSPLKIAKPLNIATPLNCFTIMGISPH
jgi:hypothetical protein